MSGWRQLIAGVWILATQVVAAAAPLPSVRHSLEDVQKVCALVRDKCNALVCQNIASHIPIYWSELESAREWLQKTERALKQLAFAKVNPTYKIGALERRQATLLRLAEECRTTLNEAGVAMLTFPRLTTHLIQAIEEAGQKLHQINTQLAEVENHILLQEMPIQTLTMALLALQEEGSRYEALLKNASYLEGIQSSPRGMPIGTTRHQLNTYVQEWADLFSAMTATGATLRLEWFGRAAGHETRYMVDILPQQRLEVWLLAPQSLGSDLNNLREGLLLQLHNQGFKITAQRSLKVGRDDAAVHLKVAGTEVKLSKQLEKLIVATDAQPLLEQNSNATIALIKGAP